MNKVIFKPKNEGGKRMPGVRIFMQRTQPIQNNMGIDVAYLKATVLEQSEQRKCKECEFSEVPGTKL